MSDFHMVVCVKAVPGSTEVRWTPRPIPLCAMASRRSSLAFVRSALECALSLKDDFAQLWHGRTRMTVVSMGIPATESLLRDCIARGADDALLLTDRAFAGADTGNHLCPQVRHRGARRGLRLLICGKMAVDGDTAQIGPELAGAFESLRDRRELCAERGLYDVWLAGARPRLPCRRETVYLERCRVR